MRGEGVVTIRSYLGFRFWVNMRMIDMITLFNMVTVCTMIMMMLIRNALTTKNSKIFWVLLDTFG